MYGKIGKRQLKNVAVTEYSRACAVECSGHKGCFCSVRRSNERVTCWPQEKTVSSIQVQSNNEMENEEKKERQGKIA
ncbi:hypothetical protein BLOT_014786 [Blomia tropicalis]|nr:hypothetical protein BLOT_014786 [Blomia tropicalis]